MGLLALAAHKALSLKPPGLMSSAGLTGADCRLRVIHQVERIWCCQSSIRWGPASSSTKHWQATTGRTTGTTPFGSQSSNVLHEPPALKNRLAQQQAKLPQSQPIWAHGGVTSWCRQCSLTVMAWVALHKALVGCLRVAKYTESMKGLWNMRTGPNQQCLAGANSLWHAAVQAVSMLRTSESVAKGWDRIVSNANS
jgi:hypothetical protein